MTAEPYFIGIEQENAAKSAKQKTVFRANEELILSGQGEAVVFSDSRSSEAQPGLGGGPLLCPDYNFYPACLLRKNPQNGACYWTVQPWRVTTQSGTIFKT